MSNKIEKIKIVLITTVLLITLGSAYTMAATINDDETKDNTPTSYTNTPLTTNSSNSSSNQSASNTSTPSNESTNKSSENKSASENTSKKVDKIPAAGKNTSLLVFAGVSVVVAVISLLKIRQFKKEN